MAVKDIADIQVCLIVDTTEIESPLWAYQALAAKTEQPEKVALRAMERAERRGLIEFGVSKKFARLTRKGYALIGKEYPHDYIYQENPRPIPFIRWPIP